MAESPTSSSRRRFLRTAAGSLGAALTAPLWCGLVAQALAAEPNNPTGAASLADIEHVVIFMQENRSFDHYFGRLAGVRGYGDPRPAPLPSGNYVWAQPRGVWPVQGFDEAVPPAAWDAALAWHQPDRAIRARDFLLPFGLNAAGDVQFQHLKDLDHHWKESQALWSNWDAWVPLKSCQSMGGLGPADIPFHYQLAAAFTVCDAYHASIFGPTGPNRYYLWTGTCIPPLNDDYDSGHNGSADITRDDNAAITPAMYGQSERARQLAIAHKIADWKTFAETLTEHGITWKLYQEAGNFSDNPLQNFKNFRIDNDGVPINRSRDPYFRSLYLRGRAFATSAGGLGAAVLEEFAEDVAAGSEPDDTPLGEIRPGLPRVSWIVAPEAFSEHPHASPAHGAQFTAQLLKSLVVDHPEVFRKTVFLMMYDENDGFFDHVPAPIPATGAGYGRMTLAGAGAFEDYAGVPVGLGPRTPLLIISPWTRGGRVSSQLHDHTSVLQFLERWLAAKQLGHGGHPRCELISPWRRAVCGDLLEAFDFGATSVPAPLELAVRYHNGTVAAATPAVQALPRQPAAVRPACAVPAVGTVRGRATPAGFALEFAAVGDVGATFMAYRHPFAGDQRLFQYTVEAGATLAVQPQDGSGPYDWMVLGPDGYLRDFRGPGVGPHLVRADAAWAAREGVGVLRLDNRAGERALRFFLVDNAYRANAAAWIDVAPGALREVPWRTVHGWYDVSVRVAGDVRWFRRLAGRTPGAAPRLTDPAIGNRETFVSALAVSGTTRETLRFDYSTPPWDHHAGNWLGVFRAGTDPEAGAPVCRIPVPRAIGSALLAEAVGAPLAAGRYEVWLFAADARRPLVAAPGVFTLANQG